MKHKGVEYVVVPTADPEIWNWRFQSGTRLVTGKTKTRIRLLAVRRVQQAIDRYLKNVEKPADEPGMKL